MDATASDSELEPVLDDLAVELTWAVLLATTHPSNVRCGFDVLLTEDNAARAGIHVDPVAPRAADDPARELVSAGHLDCARLRLGIDRIRTRLCLVPDDVELLLFAGGPAELTPRARDVLAQAAMFGRILF